MEELRECGRKSFAHPASTQISEARDILQRPSQWSGAAGGKGSAPTLRRFLASPQKCSEVEEPCNSLCLPPLPIEGSCVKECIEASARLKQEIVH